jgi:hypothetical protein
MITRLVFSTLSSNMIHSQGRVLVKIASTLCHMNRDSQIKKLENNRDRVRVSLRRAEVAVVIMGLKGNGRGREGSRSKDWVEWAVLLTKVLINRVKLKMM